jgi:hypothetical protein
MVEAVRIARALKAVDDVVGNHLLRLRDILYESTEAIKQGDGTVTAESVVKQWKNELIQVLELGSLLQCECRKERIRT